VKSRSEIGNLHAQNREFATARDDFTTAITLEHKRAAGSLTEAELLGRLAGVLQSQGFVVEAKQRWREAAALYAAALAQAERPRTVSRSDEPARPA